MLTIELYHPVTWVYLNHIEMLLNFEFTNTLNWSWDMKFCIKCDKSMVADNMTERLRLCTRAEVFCKDNWKYKVFDWYITGIISTEHEYCIEMIDCAGYMKHRIIHQDYNYPILWTGQTASVSTMISQMRSDINGFHPFSVTLGTIYAPNWLQQQQQFKTGASFYEIVSNLAEKTNAEWRVCDCKLDFSIIDNTNPYGVGKLLSGQYRSIPGYNRNNILEWRVEETMEWFCNSKLSRDKNNSKQYCVVPVSPSPTLTDCNMWECFESNPEWHDFKSEDETKKLPSITIDWSCEPRCTYKVWDKKQVLIKNCIWESTKLIAVLNKKTIRCEYSGKISVEFEFGSKASRRLTLWEYLSDIWWSIQRININN